MTAGNLEIRLARRDESHLVLALMKAAFADYSTQEHPSSALAESIHDVEAAMASGGAILAFRRGRPIASGRFEIDRDEGWLSYERLAVLPAEQHRGIGSALIDWLERHARAEGLHEIRVTARSREPDNRPYYTARGYEITGYSERYGIPDIRTHLRKRL